MSRFEPFPALRYAPTLPLDDVTAPPYDVLSAADVDRLAARHDHNIVAIDVPQPDDDPARYDHAAQRLREWEQLGILVRDHAPAFTLYRMAFRADDGSARETVGVLGALEVVDEGAGGVLPHERTTPKATTDRLDLTRATHANLSPIWGLSLTEGLTDLLRDPAEPMGTAVDELGVRHTVERVTDRARVEQIARAVASHPVLIADGHHRYAVSRTYRDEQRAIDGPGPADLTLAYVGELVEDQLSIDAIHRLYRGANGSLITAPLDTALEAVLGRSFELSPAGPIDASFAAQTSARGALCLVHRDGTGTWLTPRAGAFDGVRAIDGALLEHALSGVALEVTYQHGVMHVVDLVRAGRVDAAILIRPTGIDEIRRTADEGLLMPPKSTFFTPKLRTGLVVRPLG